MCDNISKSTTHWFCTTFINKTDPFIPTKCEDYERKILKPLDPHGLNIEESV